MAPKKVQGYVKLQITAGKATPAPPVGPALGQAQVNIMEFCKQFNARTQNKEMAGLIIPVVITVYVDRTFTFVTKTPPAAVLLKKAANLAKGSGVPNKRMPLSPIDWCAPSVTAMDGSSPPTSCITRVYAVVLSPIPSCSVGIWRP